MKLSIRAFMLTSAIFMAAVVFIVGTVNLFVSGYGWMVLQMASSIYPGYDAKSTFGSVIVGTLYALLDGAVFGFVFAWLYNLLLGKKSAKKMRN